MLEAIEVGEKFNLKFSEPVRGFINEEVFHKIYINREKEGERDVSLIFPLRNYFSFGLKQNKKYEALSLPIEINEDDEFFKCIQRYS